MKIAIPTDEGIMMSAYAQNPIGYLVLTVEGGEITGEELRWNKLSDMLTSENGTLHNLTDCSLLMVNIVTPGLQEFLSQTPVVAIATKEVIITRIIMEYLNVTMYRESNTCCSP